ncbi:MAG: sigma-70 family RNA polymerase sigma factor [Ignavibacteriae bacterium]|nr:sigma-70 family RNA polymerase sigma factor [Ignavibacteriota bacterium]
MEEHKAITETDLVTRAQNGDTTAFEQLYRQNVDRIYALCLRITANISRAEELTQQAFVRAWEKLYSFRRESAFASWLHRIAVNVVLVDYRTNQRRMARIEYSDDLESYTDNSDPPEVIADLEQAIALLPLKARTILVLHDIEGYQHEEIAIMLDISPGTSKSQLHRAHKLLRERLEQ